MSSVLGRRKNKQANRTSMASAGSSPAETFLPVSHCRTWGPAPPATLHPQRSRTACTPAGRRVTKRWSQESQCLGVSLPEQFHNQDLHRKGLTPSPVTLKKADTSPRHWNFNPFSQIPPCLKKMSPSIQEKRSNPSESPSNNTNRGCLSPAARSKQSCWHSQGHWPLKVNSMSASPNLTENQSLNSSQSNTHGLESPRLKAHTKRQ